MAEERVRTGQNASVDEVVREALEEKKRAALREALGVGLAARGRARRAFVAQGTLAEIHAELGMKRDEQGIMTLPSGWTTREQLYALHEHVESRAGKVGRRVAPQELVL
jgi:hypothetical protein